MKVKCPICSADVEWSEKSEHRPFCSKKCQLIDLGEWAVEDRSIPGPKQHSDTPPGLPDIEAMLSQQQDDFFKL